LPIAEQKSEPQNSQTFSRFTFAVLRQRGPHNRESLTIAEQKSEPQNSQTFSSAAADRFTFYDSEARIIASHCRLPEKARALNISDPFTFAVCRFTKARPA
jgi:hypothetical protein